MAKGKFSQPRGHRDQAAPKLESILDTAETQVFSWENPADITDVLDEIQPPAEVPEAAAKPIPEAPAVQPHMPEEGEEYDEEEDDEEDLTFFEKFGLFFSRNRKVLLVSICSILLAAVLGVSAFVFFSAASDPYDNLILNNVTIAGVNVGGMTKADAEAALSVVADRTFSALEMVIELPGETLRLSPAATGAKLNVSAAVKAAYSYGRTGSEAERNADYEASFKGNHTIGLLPYLELDEDYIRDALDQYAARYGSTLTQSTYTLEGARPPLDAESFSESNPCQTLVITMGTPGIEVDTDGIYEKIVDAYSLCQFQVKVKEIPVQEEPKPLDLEQIHSSVYVEAKNATVNLHTYKPVPGSYGYGFDLEKAKALVEQADYGETVTVALEYIIPEVMEDNVFFRDVLGSCETPHTKDEDRNTNLKLACEALNGMVLNPGDEFSYNDALGERTKEKGYMPAPSYSGEDTVDTYGGGICQVSSTLYYCTLIADMEIVFRVCHGFAPTYIDLGMDATVSWGNPDFKFKNTSNFPIRIDAEVSDGMVKIKLMGTDEKDYYVKMENEITNTIPYGIYSEYHEPGTGYIEGQYIQTGVIGYNVRTYRCKYNKETDELISRDFEAYSNYKMKDCIKATLIPPETTPPETQAPAPEPAPTEAAPAPEPAPTEAPPAPEPAPTEAPPAPEPAPAEPAPAPEAPPAEAAEPAA